MKRINQTGIGTALVLTILINGAIVWCSAAIVVSGFKAATFSCNKTWTIEKVIPGNWFCEAKPEEK